MTEKTSQPEKENTKINADEQKEAQQPLSKDQNAVEQQKQEKPEEKPAEPAAKAEETKKETGPADEPKTEKSEQKPEDEKVAPEDKQEPEAGEQSADKEEKAEAGTEQPETDKEAEKPEAESKSEEEKSSTEKAVLAEKTPETQEDQGDDEEEDEDDDGEEDEESPEKFNELSREELVSLLEETVKETDISKIKTRVALIKVAYLNATKEEQQQSIEKSMSEEEAEEVAQETDQLEERFNRAFSIYRQNKQDYKEEQEKLKQKNLETKKQILEDLKELINSEETLKKTYDQFRELQERWKEIGMVPRSEVNNLWQSYHFLVEKFFDKVKINKELRDLDLKKNLEAKIELCEKAEELLLERSIIKSFKELQKLHDKYKEVGPIPADKKDEVWERFKAATDKINARRREHYAQLAEQQNSNYEAKAALCEKAEDILSRNNRNMKDWQENTKQMNELFKVWRSIGPAPKKVNDEIWDRFKSALNTFFDNRREFFGKVKEQQMNNYNLKLDLCAQAEAIQDSTDWKKTTNELIGLQKQWKKIGPAPRKYSDKVWKRFRAANDHYFNKKQEYFANIHEHEAENLKAKKDLIEEVKNHEFGEDKNENLKKIKEFQRKWMDIGHVPIKEKDKVQQDFRKAVDDQLEKLHISAVEISTMNFKNKVENLKDDPNARRSLSKERNFLNGKISKLKEDITLWENNMGFLADSKKADVLKKEFNKKIDKAKQDVKILEAKLKYLNSQM